MSETVNTEMSSLQDAPLVIVEETNDHRETQKRSVLVFSNASFREGMNITIRGGQDWCDNSETGDEIDVVLTTGEYVGKGRIIWRQCFHWDHHREQIEYLISKYNHDNEYAYITAQEQLLTNSYGDKESWYPIVTIIGFELIS